MARNFGIKDMIRELDIEDDGYYTNQEIRDMYSDMVGQEEVFLPDYSEGYWPCEIPSYGS